MPFAACRRELQSERQNTLTASIRRGAIIAHAEEREVIPRGKFAQWIERNFTDWSVQQARLDRTLFFGRARLKPAAELRQKNAPALKVAGVKTPYGVVAKNVAALKLYDMVAKHKDDGASEKAAINAAIEKLKPKKQSKGKRVPPEIKILVYVLVEAIEAFLCPNDAFEWIENIKQDDPDEFARLVEEADAHWYGDPDEE